jgi:hypothetical protein
VAFQIVNYSQLYTLHQGSTDSHGIIRFRTGLGDLCVSIFHGGRMLQKKVDLRTQTDMLELELAEGFALDALPAQMAMDLVPPVGKSDVVAETENALHAAHMRACEERRTAYTATFPKPVGMSVLDMALREAAGNWPEIQAFLGDARYSLAQKEEILSTLRPKDFVDITCEVLFDVLEGVESVRGQYPEDVFRDYILAPRITDEMLLPERAKIRGLFPDGFKSPEEILLWMGQNLQIMDHYGVDNYYPSAYGCLFYRQVPAYSFDMVFVALCRAFQFPARLAPGTKEGQWMDETGMWQSIRAEEDGPSVVLTLENPTGESLRYFERFSLGCWDGRDFTTLQYQDLTMENSHSFQVRPGLYRLITTTRQIDGTATILLQHLWMKQDCSITLALPEDQTARRLKQVPLELPQGPVQAALEETAGQNRILIFADPGSEPTEHLLQEMLQCAEGFAAEACLIRIFVAEQADLDNATLQRVHTALKTVRVQVCRDPEAEAALHRLLQVGDLRLPFVIAIDAQGRGVYATANYNIHMAQTLLHIQKYLPDHAAAPSDCMEP